MIRLATFKKGGVHPEDKKVLANNQAIETPPLPQELLIPLSQHLGSVAKALKEKGESVRAGEKIGEASSYISADIHSPVNGTISDIKKITLANSVITDAFVISVDQDNPYGSWSEEPYDKLSSEQLLQQVKEMGVVGAGGATFPTHVKLVVPKGKEVDYLVINGVECEPYLTSDHRLMLEEAPSILKGVMIAAKIVNPKKIIIGIENNKKDAIANLAHEIAQGVYPIEVVALKVKYPQGDEKQLLKATIGKEVPSGKLPLDVGAVVLNVGTAFAIYEAVAKKKPFIERVVTFSGEALHSPKNLKVLIGTKVGDLLPFCDGVSDSVEKFVSGGPMMGFAFYDENTPVTKGTSGILALESKKKITSFQTPCISCGKCVSVCPMGLQPTQLFRLIEHREYEKAMKLDLMDCKECGSCSYICPAHLPLVHGMKLGKRLGRK